MIKNKMNTKLKKGIFSAVAVVVLIAAVIAVNIFVTSKNYTVDVTANKIYSLSKQTKKILKGLDKEVTIYVIDKESSVNSSYAQVWKEYKKNLFIKTRICIQTLQRNIQTAVKKQPMIV